MGSSSRPTGGPSSSITPGRLQAKQCFRRTRSRANKRLAGVVRKGIKRSQFMQPVQLQHSVNSVQLADQNSVDCTSGALSLFCKAVHEASGTVCRVEGFVEGFGLETINVGHKGL